MNFKRVARLAGVAGAALAAGSWYIFRIEPRWLRMVHKRLLVPDLPPAFDGYRIVHLSDPHLGVPYIDAMIPEVVRRVQRAQPDLIAITGDFATGRRNNMAPAAAELAGLHAPDGVWGVLGNHDYHTGMQHVFDALRPTDIRILRNEHRVIYHGTDRLVIAGLDDAVLGFPDLGATMDGVPPDSPAILMAHEPDVASLVAVDPRVVLQLSGHTHGGQIRMPGWGALYLPFLGHMYPSGAYRIGRLALYVSHGIGTGRFVVRFNCRPEITVITLVRRHPSSVNGSELEG